MTTLLLNFCIYDYGYMMINTIKHSSTHNITNYANEKCIDQVKIILTPQNKPIANTSEQNLL